MTDESAVDALLGRFYPADFSASREALVEVVRAARLRGREEVARIAVRRSCSWSAEDDRRSQDFREGIETAASQVAAHARAGTVIR